MEQEDHHSCHKDDMKKGQHLFVAVEQLRGGNIGTILRCAVAFGADAFVIVGSNKFSTHGAHGAQAHIPVLHFYHWSEFKTFVKKLNNDCEICGLHGRVRESNTKNDDINKTTVEIENFRSGIMKDVEEYNFPSSSIALILPNKRTGLLSQEQLEITDTRVCTRFVNYRSSTVADNVHLDVKASICLQRYCMIQLSSIREVKITEEKFDVEDQDHSQSLKQFYADFKTELKESISNEVSSSNAYECDNSCLFNNDNEDY